MMTKIKTIVIVFVVLLLTSFTSSQNNNKKLESGTILLVMKFDNAKISLMSNASIEGNKKND